MEHINSVLVFGTEPLNTPIVVEPIVGKEPLNTPITFDNPTGIGPLQANIRSDLECCLF
jgi:hypothetical protein